jgi:tetratricopeptide (TPR) repeat protein
VAAARYLNAVREVFARGDARRAYLLAQEALRLLEQLPGSAQRALLRAKLLLEMGRVQWHGAVLGAPFTLRAALESLQAARASLPDAAPRKVAGELATLTAGVCYDLGDLSSLELALQELTTVSRQLLEAGDATLAARLLNDQAAVYVRLGDPVRATHLLSRSRELFGGLLRENPDEPSILEELAQTEHLLARLPLHAQLRPGRESDAYAVCLDHAAAAERAYRGLDMRRELARIWETMGRLELGRERLEPARQRLSAALQLQRESGDVTGLARSTAALADVYVKADRPDEAVGLLAESVTLNFEKGSPIGLAFNRRAFQMLIDAVRRMRRPPTERLQEMLAELERRLAEAEAVLGKLTLPGDLSADG